MENDRNDAVFIYVRIRDVIWLKPVIVAEIDTTTIQHNTTAYFSLILWLS